ncbi:MAG: hypothetical protein IT269_12715, partial [Saprospiraceae bacterium]|nr:hypothetical protein [Saprospiraceae bacterium]
FADVNFLKTLHEREYRSGMAEVLKHALIGDMQLWDELRHSTTDSMLTQEQLQSSIAVKVRIVEEDPLEHGLRMLLNYGHTIGHGIESYFLGTDNPLTHGEAIAIGMACESYLAESARLQEITTVISKYFPHRHISENVFEAIWKAMLHDKKNVGRQVRIVTPDLNQPFSMIKTNISSDDLTRSLRWWNQQI